MQYGHDWGNEIGIFSDVVKDIKGGRNALFHEEK